MKRLIYIQIDQPLVIINPVLHDLSEETFELWDDCMSFPHILVLLKRHKSLKMSYKDEHWNDQEILASDALSELIQHEYDHLNGVLCTMRAIQVKPSDYVQ